MSDAGRSSARSSCCGPPVCRPGSAAATWSPSCAASRTPTGASSRQPHGVAILAYRAAGIGASASPVHRAIRWIVRQQQPRRRLQLLRQGRRQRRRRHERGAPGARGRGRRPASRWRSPSRSCAAPKPRRRLPAPAGRTVERPVHGLGRAGARGRRREPRRVRRKGSRPPLAYLRSLTAPTGPCATRGRAARRRVGDRPGAGGHRAQALPRWRACPGPRPPPPRRPSRVRAQGELRDRRIPLAHARPRARARPGPEGGRGPAASVREELMARARLAGVRAGDADRRPGLRTGRLPDACGSVCQRRTAPGERRVALVPGRWSSACPGSGWRSSSSGRGRWCSDPRRGLPGGRRDDRERSAPDLGRRRGGKGRAAERRGDRAPAQGRAC